MLFKEGLQPSEKALCFIMAPRIKDKEKSGTKIVHWSFYDKI